jgi:hypothetical protein
MVAPLVFPINARASGEKIEILRFFASASGSPTICQTRFSLVSSSITVTVAPNLTVSPESFDTSITSARTSLVLKFRDASLVDFLLGFGGLILRILGQVGVIREGVLDAFADARAIGSSAS